MNMPFGSKQPDNSPTSLASELAAAREAYIATRTDVYNRALDRVRALDEVILDAEAERIDAMHVVAQAEPEIPAPAPIGTDHDGVGLTD